MSIILVVLLLFIGLGLIVFGADWLVDGASSIARKVGISEFVIGLTIVGFGTSCPELVVSLNGAFSGNADISAGNVIGSNIFNTLMILGISAIIAPIAISKENVKRDIPITLFVTLLLCGFVCFEKLTLWGGILFLVLFAIYLFYCFKTDGGNSDDDNKKEIKMSVAVFLTLLGLAGLIIGGRLFVDSAVEIAHRLGASDKFIAITLLAGGTSLPELATCIVAAIKGKSQLALGNILGSNVFNILLILGCSALVMPIDLTNIDYIDLGAMLVGVMLVFNGAFTGKKYFLDRFDGILMLIFELSYLIWLFINASI